MNCTSACHPVGFARIKLFLALSRTTHGLLDMATPALGALLWLGSVPSPLVVVLGMLTAFAGYTAVYALNDVVDYRIDRKKVQECGFSQTGHDLDTLCARHPLAQGLLSLREGVVWTAAWGTIALVGAFTLNPSCALIFLGACAAEAVYCLMLQVTPFRTLVSGVVKTAGGMAAVFAVAPNPAPLFLFFLFMWLFFWEVGGQNVPNDWADMQEDRDLQAETIPVRWGPQGSGVLILIALGITVVLSLLMYRVTPAPLNPLYLVGAFLAGIFLLIVPARRLYKSQNARDAAALFNRASAYPLVMLILVMLC